MEQQVLKLLASADYAPANVPELLQHLQLAPGQQQELQEILRGLEHSGQITRTKGNRYILSSEADLVPGRLSINRAGKGFLQPDDSELKEIMVPEASTGTALNGDRVLVRRDVQPRRASDSAPTQETGTVIRILARKRTQIVGTLQQGRQFLYVIPDDPRIPHDVYVPAPRDVGRASNPGDKVVVELREWESRNSNPEGEIIEVLGAPDEEGVDMLSVLRQYNLPLHFPKEVLAEARAIGTMVSSTDMLDRVDCRKHQVVTIDPDDAKDFDDAICLQRVGPDQWKLWVHIADVSHYVKPGTALDEEASKRGNSTYLVDRVIPMLPEALSNELCSLKPNVDRLTKCVEFLVSDDGRVQSTKFYQAVIHSQRRFTYKEVLAVLERSPNDPIDQLLHDANDLAQKIRRLRFKAGSLALDFPEMKIRLDERGQIARIEKIENDVSHQLIEEYMLLANEAVATELMRRNLPGIYRVHEEPDVRRLNEYRQDVLGHQIACGNLTKRPEVQKLLEKFNTLSIGPALRIGFLRSLMRARYSVEPLGHYGLAKDKYAHFTSPIRRYADLVVHRALFESSQGRRTLKETADHISDTERNSADAERDSKDVKLYAFLKKQIESSNPPTYPGLVIDVRNFGFFVDVSGLAMSGLVHLSSMEDDFYIFDQQRNQLIGRRNRRVIQLGDKVQVQAHKVDSFKKQVDFRLVSERREQTDRPPARRDNDRKPKWSPPGRPQSQQRPEPRSSQRPPPRSQQRPQPGSQQRPQPGSQRPQRDSQERPQQRGPQHRPQRGSQERSDRGQQRPPQRGGQRPQGSSRPVIPSSRSQSSNRPQGQGQGRPQGQSSRPQSQNRPKDQGRSQPQQRSQDRRDKKPQPESKTLWKTSVSSFQSSGPKPTFRSSHRRRR